MLFLSSFVFHFVWLFVINFTYNHRNKESRLRILYLKKALTFKFTQSLERLTPEYISSSSNQSVPRFAFCQSHFGRQCNFPVTLRESWDVIFTTLLYSTVRISVILFSLPQLEDILNHNCHSHTVSLSVLRLVVGL